MRYQPANRICGGLFRGKSLLSDMLTMIRL